MGKKLWFLAGVLIILIIFFPIIYSDIYSDEIKVKVPKKDIFGINESFSSMKYTISDIGVKIESGIYDELLEKNKTKVIVMLKEDWTYPEKLDKKEKFELKREKIKEQQNKVLSKLMENFELENRYKTINAFSGILTNNGLKKLEQSIFVERVYLDRIVYTTLAESVPLIEADDVHNSGFTGTGAVCVIDTGVDYTHIDLGNPSCSISQTINGNNVSHSLESPHPYTDNFDFIWNITKPGFSNIAVHFNRIDVEQNFDFVQLLNAQGNVVQVFTGSHNDTWSISVPGDTISVRLVTDFSITDFGFNISQVLNGTIDSSWTNCGQIIGGFDFVNNDIDPFDGNGHGTHVSGTIASQNSVNKGVAPGTNIVAAKALSDSGSGLFSNVVAAVDWCTVNKDIYNISVISMSLGEGGEYNNPSVQCDPFATAQAISTAVGQGIFVAVASGNEAHTNGISFPACASNATSVGATYDTDAGKITWGFAPPTCTDSTTAPDQIVCFTNRGGILDLLAPGSLITSTVPGNGFATFSGTSMATPHVAALATLMLEANNTLTPFQIKDIMKNTGKPIFDSATGLTFPRINASAAVNSIAPLGEFISITLYDYPIDFANQDPNTIDNPGIGNSYIVSIDPETTINVDLYQKGEDFAGNPSTLGITNMSWLDSNNSISSFTMSTTFQDNISNISPNTNVSVYYWLDIPADQTGGSYNTTISIKAVETGISP